MKYISILVIFVVQQCYSTQLGSILLKTDRFIFNSLNNLPGAKSEDILENARCFLESIRELRMLLYPEGTNYKRAYKITNTLFSQDRPKFLNLKISPIVSKLEKEYGWTKEEVDKFTDLFYKADRIKAELYRVYKRTAFTEKPRLF